MSVDQWSFTSPFEGVIPHLYLDTRGNVTCGVGFLVRTRSDVARFEWRPDTATAESDFDAVSKAAKGYVASHYEAMCRASLTESTMRAHFDTHVMSVRLDSGMAMWTLDALPDAAQLALVDMAFNLGVAGLAKFKKLHAAVMARDWLTAAAESSRRGVQASRNTATAEAFRSCAQSSGGTNA